MLRIENIKGMGKGAGNCCNQVNSNIDGKGMTIDTGKATGKGEVKEI